MGKSWKNPIDPSKAATTTDAPVLRKTLTESQEAERLKNARGMQDLRSSLAEGDALETSGRDIGPAIKSQGLGIESDRAELTKKIREPSLLEHGQSLDDRHPSERTPQALSANPHLAELRSRREKKSLVTPTIVPRIGVSYRTDGLGGAHTGHDKTCLDGVNELGSRDKPSLEELEEEKVSSSSPPQKSGGLTFPLKPVSTPEVTQTVEYPPRPKAPTKAEGESKVDWVKRSGDYEEERKAWLRESGRVNEGVVGAREGANLDEEFEKIDGLYLAGAAAAIHSQHGESEEDQSFMMPKPEGVDERESRANYEHSMIAKARNSGMPMMGICAGSWRLLEAFGGRVDTLPAKQRDDHYRPGADTWKTSHALNSRPNTMVGATFPQTEIPNPELKKPLDDSSSSSSSLVEEPKKKLPETVVTNTSKISSVNSTHWAVASKDKDDKLVANGKPMTKTLAKHQTEGRLPTNPDEELEISATAPAPNDKTTVEAFESRHGAPVIGAQWHPEGYLPGSQGRGKGNVEAEAQGDELFRGFQQASKAYAARKLLNKEFHGTKPK